MFFLLVLSLYLLCQINLAQALVINNCMSRWLHASRLVIPIDCSLQSDFEVDPIFDCLSVIDSFKMGTILVKYENGQIWGKETRDLYPRSLYFPIYSSLLVGQLEIMFVVQFIFKSPNLGQFTKLKTALQLCIKVDYIAYFR